MLTILKSQEKLTKDVFLRSSLPEAGVILLHIGIIIKILSVSLVILNNMQFMTHSTVKKATNSAPAGILTLIMVGIRVIFSTANGS